MKKFLIKTMALSLMLLCFFNVGCKVSTSSPKDALKICNQYIDNVEALQEHIKNDYEYPLESAQSVAEGVEEGDRSHINILYSEYVDFDFDGSARKDTDGVGGSLFAPRTLYWMSADLIYQFKDYIDCLNEDNFKLDTSYKYYDAKLDRNEYFKISKKNDRIYVYVRIANQHTQYIIETDSNGWTNIERRAVSIDEEGNETYYNYFYLEKATNENRLFNRNSVVTWTVKSTGDQKDQIRTYDLNEVTQKMIFFDTVFEPETAEGNPKDLHNFMLTLNFEEFVGAVDVENAVAVN